ncbi:hypothetical protein TRIATDRAFT_181620, partial [Trichoderma atroviride IMI 206040]
TVPDAEFHPGLDEYGRGSLECLPQTREEILKEICDWLDDSTSQKHIYWLQGKAGTGKTTISRTVVSRMAGKNRIIANFFFKRGEGDRARLKRFFTTLVAQLVRKLPSFAKAIQDALESDPSLLEQDPKVQFKKFIQEPIQKQKFEKSKTIIVVVDALDECDSKEDLAALIQLVNQPVLPDGSSAQLPFKYFLTSRLDHHTQPISNKTPEQICEKKELETATLATMKRDIELYFRFHLKNIDGLLDPTPTGDPWSNPSNFRILEELTERAYPLFEFAAAACRFIGQTTIPGEPLDRLNDILKSQISGDLDMVYESILKQRFYNLKGQSYKSAKAQFQTVIGSVISLADSVDVRCLAQLTGSSEKAIRQELRCFASVLVVPTENDDQSLIRLFHESFRDFLTGLDTDEEFKVDSSSAHKLLASRCRQFLCESLQENICKLESPGTDRREVADETINEFLPHKVQYACRFWIFHVKRSQSSIKDDDDWHSFLRSHLLHWLEALSLLGRTSESASLVKELKTIIHVSAFLEDAERLILSFRHIIDAAPLQLYSSVLTFAPTGSLVRETFDTYRAKWISRTPNVDSQWGQYLQTLEGHVKGVCSVAFSPDGNLASADNDNIVKIWNPISGICLQTFRVNDRPGWGVIILSSDGQWAAYASEGEIRVLDLSSQVNPSPKTLEGAKDPRFDLVACFSRDNRYLACVQQDDTVAKIWDISSAICLQAFHESEEIKALAFSQDGRLLGMGCWGGKIIIWDWKNNPRHQTLTGHESLILSLSFSTDGAWLASASFDCTVKIWDATVHDSEEKYTPHVDARESIEAQVGQRLTFLSPSSSLQVWDTFTSSYIAHLLKKAYSDIKISADGRIVAAVSIDEERPGTGIEIWHVESGNYSTMCSRYSNSEGSIALSGNGERFIIGFDEGIIQVWESRTG